MSKKKNYMTTGGERFSYGLYFLGQNIFYIFIYLFLAVFFTDVGIPAMTVAIIALVVKVWDAVNDPIFGGILDGIRLKKGKFLPWLRISLIALPITTVLIFAIQPNMPMGMKIAWAVIAYMLWDTAYTLCDVPIFGLVTVMTDNQNERTSLMSIGRVSASIASMLIYFIVPTFRKAIGGWLPTIAILSAFVLVTMIPVCFKAKERITPPASEKEVGIKEMFRYLKSNKYLLIFYIALFISYSTNIANTLGMYFARHCLHEESKQTIMSLISLVPALILGICIPKICKRIDKFILYFYSSVAMAVLSIIIYLFGYQNELCFYVMLFIRAIPLGFTTMLMYMFTPDCAEYGFYKTGINASGIAFSLQTFSVKLMTAVGTALSTFFLAMIGFVEGDGAVQPAGFEGRLWFIYAVVPAIGAVLALIVLRLYKLRDKDVQIMARCNAGQISREEADKLLEGRYR